MDLPIDFAKRPFKPKYVDEETLVTNRWFTLGRTSEGLVISDGQTDVFINVPPYAAERIVAARNDFVDAILSELNRFPPDAKGENKMPIKIKAADAQTAYKVWIDTLTTISLARAAKSVGGWQRPPTADEQVEFGPRIRVHEFRDGSRLIAWGTGRNLKTVCI